MRDPIELDRVNPSGVRYVLIQLGDIQTSISTGNKCIIVNQPIERLNRSWYNWTMSGVFIQSAFDYLSADEREFLITGLTAAEWDNLFPPEDDYLPDPEIR